MLINRIMYTYKGRNNTFKCFKFRKSTKLTQIRQFFSSGISFPPGYQQTICRECVYWTITSSHKSFSWYPGVGGGGGTMFYRKIKFYYMFYSDVITLNAYCFNTKYCLGQIKLVLDTTDSGQHLSHKFSENLELWFYHLFDRQTTIETKFAPFTCDLDLDLKP